MGERTTPRDIEGTKASLIFGLLLAAIIIGGLASAWFNPINWTPGGSFGATETAAAEISLGIKGDLPEGFVQPTLQQVPTGTPTAAPTPTEVPAPSPTMDPQLVAFQEKAQELGVKGFLFEIVKTCWPVFAVIGITFLIFGRSRKLGTDDEDDGTSVPDWLK